MAARRSRTRHVERHRAGVYLKKAAEFLASMRQALEAGRWNAVGLNAVHAAISACDAVLVYHTEERSASQDHEAAAYLLASLTKIPDVKQKAEALRRIVEHKNLIAYEDRSFSAHEAAEIAKLTERFLRWAQEIVGS